MRQHRYGAAFSLFTIDMLTLAEQQGDTPKTRQTNKRINDSAQDGILAAEQPCNKVKLEDTNKAPVQAADDRENQCYRIHMFYLHYFLWLSIEFP